MVEVSLFLECLCGCSPLKHGLNTADERSDASVSDASTFFSCPWENKGRIFDDPIYDRGVSRNPLRRLGKRGPPVCTRVLGRFQNQCLESESPGECLNVTVQRILMSSDGHRFP